MPFGLYSSRSAGCPTAFVGSEPRDVPIRYDLVGADLQRIRRLWDGPPGMVFAALRGFVTRVLDRLTGETRGLHKEIEGEADLLLRAISVPAYRRYLARWYGFVAPLERALRSLPGLSQVIDPRRLRKHQLLGHDLQALHLKQPAIAALPQCEIPSFIDVRDAMGWAFVVERTTLDHPGLFRRLASVIPGDMAFASAYLTCYAGSVGEMWRSFEQSLETAAPSEGDSDRIVSASQIAYRHFRRWRNSLDGHAPSHAERRSS